MNLQQLFCSQNINVMLKQCQSKSPQIHSLLEKLYFPQQFTAFCIPFGFFSSLGKRKKNPTNQQTIQNTQNSLFFFKKGKIPALFLWICEAYCLQWYLSINGRDFFFFFLLKPCTFFPAVLEFITKQERPELYITFKCSHTEKITNFFHFLLTGSC